MELRHIRYFLAVAEEANFTRAAARVGIGQPPLSQQIRALEDELGVQLFRRKAYGAELTEAGQAFHAAVKTMPAQAQAAARQAQRAGRGEIGVIRVGFTASAGLMPLIPAALRTYKREYPDVELVLVEANSTTLARQLHEGALDVGFLRPEAVDLSGLRTEVVAEEDMVLALPSRHAAEGEAALLYQLKDVPLILTPRTLGPTVFDAALAACRGAGFEPRMGQPAPQLSSVIALVAAELGFSIVPASVRQLALEGVVFRPLQDVTPKALLSLVTSKTPPAVVNRFAGLVHRVLHGVA
ncbi:LysR family transcriptional regulator [Brevundimonas sp.]|uniref:LysR family transcriptional regulator n=1 Tax=Brevundimonas sp. TaxID=1871086 RepID=UPI0028A7DAE9|nr:LysR family transcriptional regulator [Brevundimonas sp.]